MVVRVVASCLIKYSYIISSVGISLLGWWCASMDFVPARSAATAAMLVSVACDAASRLCRR